MTPFCSYDKIYETFAVTQVGVQPIWVIFSEVNMDWNFAFFFNSILTGAGLAMDAFSVSMADGIREPKMSGSKMIGIAGVFGFFQGLMPLIGWVCIHTVVQHFASFQALIPWIALALLGYIGGKMLYEGIKSQSCPVVPAKLGFAVLMMQGIATSIDALSIGFTISEYQLPMALAAAFIIMAVTFVTCFIGLIIGKKAGSCLSGKTGIVGGIILIFIGLEIFIANLF